MSALIRRAAGPVVRRVDSRVDAVVRPAVVTTAALTARLDAHDSAAQQVGSRLRDLEMLVADGRAGLTTLAEQLRGREEHLAELEATLAELLALTDALSSRYEHIVGRLEFVRREVMFEVRYGGSRSDLGEVEPRIVNQSAVDEMAPDLRINVGCGHLPLPGFINVDARELPGVDVIAEATNLPFDPGTVSHLHSAHLLEHFPREQLRREVLPYWRSLLRPGGTLTAVVPDAPTMLREHQEGRLSFDDLNLVLYGEQEYEGDFHFTMFSFDVLREVLTEAGFDDVQLVEHARRNGVCYEMEIAARGADEHRR